MNASIAGMPVAYRVMGVPIGLRKPVLHHVFEVVPHEIGRTIESEHEFDFAGTSVRVADDRFWFPVIGFADGRHDVARDIDGWSRGRSAIRDGGIELSKYARTAYERRAVAEVATLQDLTKLAEIVVDNHAFPTDRLQPFDSPRHLDERFVQNDHLFVSLKGGRSLADVFRSVSWSEREIVVGRLAATSDRLALVDGVLCDSRYEPLVDVCSAPSPFPVSHLYDRVDGSIVRIRSNRPATGSLEISRPTQEGLPLSLRDLSVIRPDLVETLVPGLDRDRLPVETFYDPAVLALSQVWRAIGGHTTALSLPVGHRSPEMMASGGRIASALAATIASPDRTQVPLPDLTDDVRNFFEEIVRSGSPAYAIETARLGKRVENYLDRMDTITTCRTTEPFLDHEPDVAALVAPSWGPRGP